MPLHVAQVDETNFKAALGQDTLRVIEIIINRSKRMARIVAEDRQAQGGLPALREQVLQVNNTERGGCLPNEAQPPLVGPVIHLTWSGHSLYLPILLSAACAAPS